jgi:hypothetical protein
MNERKKERTTKLTLLQKKANKQINKQTKKFQNTYKQLYNNTSMINKQKQRRFGGFFVFWKKKTLHSLNSKQKSNKHKLTVNKTHAL